MPGFKGSGTRVYRDTGFGTRDSGLRFRDVNIPGPSRPGCRVWVAVSRPVKSDARKAMDYNITSKNPRPEDSDACRIGPTSPRPLGSSVRPSNTFIDKDTLCNKSI